MRLPVAAATHRLISFLDFSGYAKEQLISIYGYINTEFFFKIDRCTLTLLWNSTARISAL
jgi:hypothetical protein